MVAIAAALVSDPVARWAANARGGDIAGDCLQATGLKVELGRWPAGVRVAVGSLTDVSATADAVTLGPLTVRHLDAHVGRVTLSPAGLLTGDPRVSVRHGLAGATIAASDLDGYLRYRGVPASVVIDATGLQVEAAGIRIPLVVRPDRGALVLAPAIPLLSGLSMRLAVPGVSVVAVEPEPGALRVRAQFEGDPKALACAARRALD